MEKSKKELSEEEYVKLAEDISNFDASFYSTLAGSDRYEVIPTVLEDGSSLNREQYALIKAECVRLGLKIIYQIELADGTIVHINPENLKVGYSNDAIH